MAKTVTIYGPVKEPKKLTKAEFEKIKKSGEKKKKEKK